MADDHPNGFLKFARNPIAYRDPVVRIGDYNEVYSRGIGTKGICENRVNVVWIVVCRPVWAVVQSEISYRISMISFLGVTGPRLSSACMRQTISLSSQAIPVPHHASRLACLPVTTIQSRLKASNEQSSIVAGRRAGSHRSRPGCGLANVWRCRERPCRARRSSAAQPRRTRGYGF